MKFYPYSKQTIDQKEINAVIKTLKSDFITQGPKILEFEKNFSNFVGSKYAVACSSGTAALHLSCLALNLKKKSNVAVPTITFLATANCTQFSHDCNINFVDIEKDSACISVEHLEKILKIKPISLVIVVHMSGQIVDLKKINTLKKNNYGSSGAKIFLMKWGITIKFFKKFYLKSNTKYEYPLSDPSINFNYLFNLFLCKINLLYIKLFYSKS